MLNFEVKFRNRKSEILKALDHAHARPMDGSGQYALYPTNHLLSLQAFQLLAPYKQSKWVETYSYLEKKEKAWLDKLEQ